MARNYCQTFASQECRLDRIPPPSFLPQITANLDVFLRRFNEVQYWIVTELVSTPSLSKRVGLVRKFIKLAA